jgi:hypothetical protein
VQYPPRSPRGPIEQPGLRDPGDRRTVTMIKYTLLPPPVQCLLLVRLRAVGTVRSSISGPVVIHSLTWQRGRRVA